MFFKKITRPITPYSDGYTAPSTDSYNTESPTFKIAAPLSSLDEIEEKNLRKIEWIQLRVQLIPLKIDHKGPIIKYEDSFFSYNPSYLYESLDSKAAKSSCHKGISLLFGGVGSYLCTHEEGQNSRGQKVPILNNKLEENQLILQEDNVLYTHLFLSQERGEINMKNSLDKDQNQYIDPPGCINGVPVWVFGGYYQPGCSLEESQQFYFSLTQDRELTIPYLIPESHWIKTGVPIPKGEKKIGKTIVFMEGGEHPPNLAMAIQGGAVAIQLHVGSDEKGESVREDYYSYDYQRASGEFIDIHFKARS